MAAHTTEILQVELRRVGGHWRPLIMNHPLVVYGPDGLPRIRNPETWKEAHKVLVELESRSDVVP